MLRRVPKGLRPAAFVWLALLVAIPFARTELMQSIVAIAAIFIGLPTFLIGLLDVVRDHDEAARDEPRSIAARLAVAPARIAVALLGLSGIVIGVAIVAWVLYNLFVERQAEFTGVEWLQPFGIGPLLVVMGLGLVRSALGRRAGAAPAGPSADFDESAA